MVCDLIDERSIFYIPKLCCPIETTRGDQVSIWAEGNVSYTGFMRWKNKQFLPCDSIPYDRGSIKTSCCKAFAIGTERYI